MGTWNYRVIKSVNEFGELYYQIHEVYYNKAGELTMHSDYPEAACGETLEELRKDLEFMLKSVEEPVLEADKIVFAKPDWDEENSKTIPIEELSKQLGLEHPLK